MTTDLKSLAAPGVQHLKPYQGGKPIEELERELGIQGAIKLASNENPLGLSPVARQAIEASLDEGSRYPDGNGYYLKCKLAEKLNVSPDQLTLGNGSNDVLDLLARAFLGPHSPGQPYNGIFSQHAFVIYQLAVTAQGADSIVVPAKNWGHDLTAMANAINNDTRLIFIANPNNPTGTWLTFDELEQFMAKVPAQVIVVVDEAYFEYVDLPGYGSAVTLINQYPNLVVTRTFSKAYGLASLRVGYGISHPDVADILNRIRQPFNINSMALAAAVAVLDDEVYLENSLEVNHRGYQQLVAGFEQMGLNFIPSAGNFVAVEISGDVQVVYQRLLEQGVIVRPISLYEMPNHLRVSIGLPEENQRFLDVLATLLALEEPMLSSGEIS